MTYSFSRLNSIDNCPYEWKRSYIDNEKGEENSFALGGSFCHELCEDVANGKITTKEASERFKNEWHERVYLDYPKFESGYDLKEHYYRKIQPFFDRKAYWKSKVVAVEEHVVCELPSGEKFQGFIDMQISDGVSHSLLDWKISKVFSGDDLIKKQRQLYLYAFAVHQLKGYHPNKLIFAFFQSPATPIVINFSKHYMNEAVQWAEGQIVKIKNHIEGNDFEPDFSKLSKSDGTRDMYCKNLCSHRNSCKYVEGDYFKQ